MRNTDVIHLVILKKKGTKSKYTGILLLYNFQNGALELRSEIVSQQAYWVSWRALDKGQPCPASLCSMRRDSRLLLSGIRPFLWFLEGCECMNCKDCDCHACKGKRCTCFHLCSPTFSSWFTKAWTLKAEKSPSNHLKAAWHCGKRAELDICVWVPALSFGRCVWKN